MSLTVRPATDADIEGLMEVDGRSWDATSTPSALPAISDFGSERTPLARVLVAELDGRVAGYVMLGDRSNLPAHAHVAQIRSIAVDPSVRRAGVGRALIEAAIARVRSEGRTRLVLNALATNGPALKLYRSVGFAIEGVHAREFRIDGAWVDDYILGMSVVPEPPAAPEWLEGGCHCGAVRFRVRIREWEVLDCNCSICTKKGILHRIAEPEDFELLQGADALATYRFGTGIARHHFCQTCGIHPFYRPRSHPEAWDVNARCLDGDALSRFRILPFDGRDWERSVDAIR